MKKVSIVLGMIILLAGFFLVFHPNTTVSGTKVVIYYVYLPGSPDYPTPEKYQSPEITRLEDIRVARAILYVDSPRPELNPQPGEVLYIHEVKAEALVRLEVQGSKKKACQIKLTDPEGNLLLDKVTDTGYKFDFEAEKGYYELEMMPFREGDWYGYNISLSDSYFYPITVKSPQPVALFKFPYGPLGILFLVLGGFLTFWGLPANTRFKALGSLLALCGIGFAFGFSFNWFYDWYYSAGGWGYGEKFLPWLPLAVICCAVAGGFIIGRSFIFKKKWLAIILVLLTSLGLFTLAFKTFPDYYYSYADPTIQPYPYYHSFSGDYLIEAFLLLFIQFCIFLGLFGGFLVGLITKKKSSWRRRDY